MKIQKAGDETWIGSNTKEENFRMHQVRKYLTKKDAFTVEI